MSGTQLRPSLMELFIVITLVGNASHLLRLFNCLRALCLVSYELMFLCCDRIEILCHDINVHIPHHISPRIPSYNLRAAHESIQENWGKVMTTFLSRNYVVNKMTVI